VETEAIVESSDSYALKLRVEAAQYEALRDPVRGFARLNAMFRDGTPLRAPIDGPTNGQMIAADVAPFVTPAVVRLISSTKPWMGKTFDAANATGENLLTPAFVSLAKVFFPEYRGFRPMGEHAFAGFSFRTYDGDGLQDPDRRVLKIDYDDPVNPPAMRRILDELVQLDDNYYLGKAHFRVSPGKWHLLFYFALQRRDANGQAM